MGLTGYLAQTAAEFASVPAPPWKKAWMACHFSPYGRGLTNLPRQDRGNFMVILDDSTPIAGHDPGLILEQLLPLAAAGPVLLDFERPKSAEYQALANALLDSLPCPVGMAPAYASDLDCPVFLPPVPLRTPLQAYLRSWVGREIWLEGALDGETVTVSPAGASALTLSHPAAGEMPLEAPELHCHYRLELREDQAKFTLRRTPEDLSALLHEAERLGVTTVVGLWQELGDCGQMW